MLRAAQIVALLGILALTACVAPTPRPAPAPPAMAIPKPAAVAATPATWQDTNLPS